METAATTMHTTIRTKYSAQDVSPTTRILSCKRYGAVKNGTQVAKNATALKKP